MAAEASRMRETRSVSPVLSARSASATKSQARISAKSRFDVLTASNRPSWPASTSRRIIVASSVCRMSFSNPGMSPYDAPPVTKESSERGWNQSGRGLRYSSTMRLIDGSSPRKAKGAINAPVLTPVTTSKLGRAPPPALEDAGPERPPVTAAGEDQEVHDRRRRRPPGSVGVVFGLGPRERAQDHLAPEGLR